MISEMFKIGADPELFLKDAQGGLISAIGKIGGSKEMPRPLPLLGEGYAVQEDNVALEFNIPAAENEEAFVGNINATMQFLLHEIRAKGLSFDMRSAVEFPIEELNTPEAFIFGCDPDFNAWEDGAPNPKPHAENMQLRSAGGHVHVGYKFKNNNEVLSFIKRADLFLGVPSVLMDVNGGLRRELYGSPGAFRWKPYGCEYRTLSNFWIFNPQTVKWVYQNTKLALESVVDVDNERELIMAAIKENNLLAATELIDRYNIPFVV